MKSSKKSSVKRFGRFRQLSLALVGALALSAGAAQAFTFTDQNGNTGDPRQGYLDLDTKPSQGNQPAAGVGNDNTNPLQWGNSTLQFGGATQRSFNQRYNADHLFDPYARDGR